MTDEKLKIWIDVIKWLIGSVVLVIITTIIDTGFKEREMAIKEMAKFDSYIDLVTSADKIIERKKLAQFFKTMTISEDVQCRWSEYYDLVSKEYDDTLAARNSKIDTLNHYLSKPDKTLEDSQKIEQIKQDINNINYQITTSITPSNSIQLNKINAAYAFEKEGFIALKNEDFKGAAENFNAAEDNYPTLHNNYELGNLLSKKSVDLENAPTEQEKSTIKKDAYKLILKKYPYKMPADIKVDLQKKADGK